MASQVNTECSSSSSLMSTFDPSDRALLWLISLSFFLSLLALFNSLKNRWRFDKKKKTNKTSDYCEEEREECWSGRTVLITGASEGVGAELARSMAHQGARLVLLTRDLDKCRLVARQIVAEHPTAQVSLQHIDLSSLNSIRVCVNEILNLEPRIDALVLGASVAYLPKLEKSIDGHEMQLATNFLGHFLLVQLLVDRMQLTAKEYDTVVRVINLTSPAHRFGKIHLSDLSLEKIYTPFRAYAQSKLALLLTMREMARQWKESRVHLYSVELALTNTNHYHNLHPVLRYLVTGFGYLGFQSAQSAAKKVERVLTSRTVQHQTGYCYRKPEEVILPAPQATDEKMVHSLWNWSMKACGLQESVKLSEVVTS